MGGVSGVAEIKRMSENVHLSPAHERKVRKDLELHEKDADIQSTLNTGNKVPDVYI